MLFHFDRENAHPIYKSLRESHPTLTPIRENLEALWRVYEKYSEPDFLRGFATAPHQRFWEMWLTCCFIEAGFPVDKNTGYGPDICTTYQGKRMWVEAITPTTGDFSTPDRVPAHEPGTLRRVPTNEIILRYAGAIRKKKLKFDQYISDGVVQPDDFKLIAISGAEFFPSDHGTGLPYILRTVFPIGALYAVVDANEPGVVRSGYHSQPYLWRHSGAAVDTTLFLDPSSEQISGLIYLGPGMLSIPFPTSLKLITVRNPSSNPRLPLGWLPVGREYYLKDVSDSYELHCAEHEAPVQCHE